LKDVVEGTKGCSGLTLSIALGYSSKDEIITAVNRMLDDCKEKKLKASAIDSELFSSYLLTDGMPDPDLIVKTSTKKDDFFIDDFFLWQMSYSEFCLVDKLFLEFESGDFGKLIDDYAQRERRFGGI